MAVGSPFLEIPDDSGHQIKDAGSVFVYRRNADIGGQKADWDLQTQLMLPIDFRRDYISREISNVIRYNDFSIDGKKWNVGQEGRELGHAVDIGVSGSAETIVVGAPGAGWTRQFDTIAESGIPVAMMVFTDKYEYKDQEIANLINISEARKHLYRYFSAPWNADSSEEHQFQPRIDVKLLVFQSVKSDFVRKPVKSNIQSFSHTYIDSLRDIDLLELSSYENIKNGMVSGIQDAFFEMFPHQNSVHSGIPPIIGIFEDNSPSTAQRKYFDKAVDGFIDFYEEYAFESGVHYQTTDLPATGYIERISGVEDADVFLPASINLLNTTLDTGNLNNVGALEFITSGIGQEWANPNAYQFQIPTSSG